MNIVVGSLASAVVWGVVVAANGGEPRPPTRPEAEPIVLAHEVRTTLPVLVAAADEALKSSTIETAEEGTFLELAVLVELLKRDKSPEGYDRQKALDAARPRLMRGLDMLRRQAAKAPRPVVTAQQISRQLPAAPPTAATPAHVQGARQLIDVITGVLRPDTWEVNGGLGTIRYWALGHALIIHQSADVHEQVGGLLNSVR